MYKYNLFLCAFIIQICSQNIAIHQGPEIFSNVNDLGDDQAPKTVNSAPNPENIAPG